MICRRWIQRSHASPLTGSQANNEMLLGTIDKLPGLRDVLNQLQQLLLDAVPASLQVQ